ncbi:MAG: J domain-containing protein [Actinobacteria bacterium]|nr:J domain-containing protein [Actinomycetota bacterium]
MDSQRADLYRVLGLSPDASGPDIARAYRQQARAVHPDTRPGDPDALVRFRALTDAYEVLSDPDRRDAYDRQRAPAAPAPPPPMPFSSGPAMTWLRPVSRPPAGAGGPLWAGPVHVQPPAGPPRPGGQDQRRDAVRAALAAYLIRRYLAGQDWL